MCFHFLVGGFYFQLQFPGRHSQHAGSQGRKLHQTIGGGYPHGIVSADLIHKTFNVSVGGLIFLGVDHLDVVEAQLLSGDLLTRKAAIIGGMK